jgi:diguanylate cyclase (GGDEF)-like protein
LVLARTNHQLVLEREERLVVQATTDALTGLPNRTLFNDRLDQALKRLERSGDLLAVIVVDLDDFKNVNDSLGHLAGDALLVAVADRFRSRLRGFDTIARVGGDEFAILVDGLTEQSGAEVVAERVREALAEPLHFSGRTASIDASVGIAIAYHSHTAPRTLLGQADAAMYRTKREGRGGYRVFETAMQVAAVERLNLEQELRSALARGRITAHYQPIVDSVTGTVTGFEALARWPHDTQGMVSPDSFIPLAEDSGLVAELGRAVLAEACHIAERWHAQFRQISPTVSVNVSRVQLVDPSFVEDVVVALTNARLEPAALVLEVTESVLARDPDRMSARLNELRRLGTRVAIDDFGTGYSSFAALAELPIDILKIDKRFTDRVHRDEEGRGFVMAILQLAETLGLETIAEGVERGEQRDVLIELGCTHIQGFLYSPPMPGDLTHEYLAASLDRQPTPTAIGRRP